MHFRDAKMYVRKTECILELLHYDHVHVNLKKKATRKTEMKCKKIFSVDISSWWDG